MANAQALRCELITPDRLVLDLPEPWGLVPAAREGLESGGVLCAYVPTVPQVEQTVAALGEAGCFTDLMTFEVLLREWNIAGRSVRPGSRSTISSRRSS